jgi:DNA-binding protein YbaB
MTTAAEHITATADRITEQCRMQRLRYSSPDKLISVVVDGNGRLVDLTIAPGALRGAHTQLLAGTIGKAINTARHAARSRQNRLFTAAVKEES